MQSTMRILVPLFLFSSVLANAYHSSAKLRRDGVLNLYPFPRVGRASRNTWQIPPNEYLEYEPVEKRQLYAFPRVGRNDLSLLRGGSSHESEQTTVSREGEGAMWFGPRVGRSLKTDDNEYEPVEKRQLYAFPRVGRNDLSLLRGESSHEVAPMPVSRDSMWFGPRLGRSLKTDDDEITIQNQRGDHSDSEQTGPVQIEREKRHAI